jgi:hypothetical protein
VDQFFERVFYGSNPAGRPLYTHAAIYVGTVGGVRTVVEMDRQNGYVSRSLDEYLQENRQVDVYRRNGITRTQQDSVAKLARSYDAVETKPLFGSSYMMYALPQHELINHLSFTLGRKALVDSIASWPKEIPQMPDTLKALLNVLSDAAAQANKYQILTTLEMQALAAWTDLQTGGRKGFTDAELVDWCFDLAGLAPQLTPWRAFQDMGLWTSKERQYDLTTPNILARSLSFQFVAALKQP